LALLNRFFFMHFRGNIHILVLCDACCRGRHK
jgi:hypothetical protein